MHDDADYLPIESVLFGKWLARNLQSVNALHYLRAANGEHVVSVFTLIVRHLRSRANDGGGSVTLKGRLKKQEK